MLWSHLHGLRSQSSRFLIWYVMVSLARIRLTSLPYVVCMKRATNRDDNNGVLSLCVAYSRYSQRRCNPRRSRPFVCCTKRMVSKRNSRYVCVKWTRKAFCLFERNSEIMCICNTCVYFSRNRKHTLNEYVSDSYYWLMEINTRNSTHYANAFYISTAEMLNYTNNLNNLWPYKYHGNTLDHIFFRRTNFPKTIHIHNHARLDISIRERPDAYRTPISQLNPYSTCSSGEFGTISLVKYERKSRADRPIFFFINLKLLIFCARQLITAIGISNRSKWSLQKNKSNKR